MTFLHLDNGMRAKLLCNRLKWGLFCFLVLQMEFSRKSPKITVSFGRVIRTTARLLKPRDFPSSELVRSQAVDSLSLLFGLPLSSLMPLEKAATAFIAS